MIPNSICLCRELCSAAPDHGIAVGAAALNKSGTVDGAALAAMLAAWGTFDSTETHNLGLPVVRRHNPNFGTPVSIIDRWNPERSSRLFAALMYVPDGSTGRGDRIDETGMFTRSGARVRPCAGANCTHGNAQRSVPFFFASL